MGVALLDSSVVMAFLDAEDALHGAADAALRRAASEHGLAVSAISVAEVLTGAKLGHHDEPLVRRFLREVVRTPIAADDAVAERAAGLRAAHRALRLPDALILATGDLHADVVITGDAGWRRVRDLARAVVALDG